MKEDGFVLEMSRSLEIQAIEGWPPPDERLFEASQKHVSGDKAAIVVEGLQQQKFCKLGLRSDSFSARTELRLKAEPTDVKNYVAVVERADVG